MTQNHSLISDPSWLCEEDNPKSLFRCEKEVASITCIHAAPPPIFVPSETLWANYTNITIAASEAKARFEEEARVRKWKLEHPPCPNFTLPSPVAVQQVAAAFTTFKDQADYYRKATWSLAVCLLISLLINTLPLCYILSRKVRV